MNATGPCWMAERPNGALAYHTASYSREGARECLLKNFPRSLGWKKLYRGGWRIVRVSVAKI